MKLKLSFVGVLAAGLLAGCATTTPGADTAAVIAAAEANAPMNCSTNRTRMTSQMRQRCAGIRTIDTAFMEQQIHPCTGSVCGR